MQGIKDLIPAQEKADYLNALLKAGFSILDFGSFVSPKAIPQMADTAEVLSLLSLTNTSTKLLAIIGNMRGAMAAAQHPEIDFWGYPFSISPTFGARNTNKSMEQARKDVLEIASLAREMGKSMLVYISMAFGNPYGDDWSPSMISDELGWMSAEGIAHFRLADTTGMATAELIGEVFTAINSQQKGAEIGAHLHSNPATAHLKVKAAWQAGCTMFDTAMLGLGGCPMAADELTGNVDTLTAIAALSAEGASVNIDDGALQLSAHLARNLFAKYH